jgi:glycosyltransferase involved in cell wall biosynthesis
MGQPLISGIVPAFNGERYLRETLDSMLAQTHRPLEIIVVDDGSTDGTPDVAASYGDKVRYLRQDNAGPATARNRGLNAARGEFVAFLDADDLWHPEKSARQMAHFAARPELGLCITHVQNFWIPELAAEAERYRDHPLSRPVPGYLTQTLLARRSVFETVGQFDPGLHHAEKTDWFLRALGQGAVLELLPDVLVYRRLHETNVSRSLGAASRDEYLRLLKASLDRRRLNEAAPRSSGLPDSHRREKK